LAERPEESDDGYDEEDDDEDEINDEIMQSMRWMFQRAEGEELEEEFEEEEDEEETPDVPLSYIMENLTTMNYNFEDMVRILLNDFLDSDQDERSVSILETVDNLIDRYEGTTTVTTPAATTDTPVVSPNTDDEDSDSDEEEVADDIKTFVPKINFNVVKRYQTTSYLCGNN
jgi:hypothetical protein